MPVQDQWGTGHGTTLTPPKPKKKKGFKLPQPASGPSGTIVGSTTKKGKTTYHIPKPKELKQHVPWQAASPVYGANQYFGPTKTPTRKPKWPTRTAPLVPFGRTPEISGLEAMEERTAVERFREGVEERAEDSPAFKKRQDRHYAKLWEQSENRRLMMKDAIMDEDGVPETTKIAVRDYKPGVTQEQIEAKRARGQAKAADKASTWWARHPQAPERKAQARYEELGTQIGKHIVKANTQAIKVVVPKFKHPEQSLAASRRAYLEAQWIREGDPRGDRARSQAEKRAHAHRAPGPSVLESLSTVPGDVGTGIAKNVGRAIGIGEIRASRSGAPVSTEPVSVGERATAAGNLALLTPLPYTLPFKGAGLAARGLARVIAPKLTQVATGARGSQFGIDLAARTRLGKVLLTPRDIQEFQAASRLAKGGRWTQNPVMRTRNLMNLPAAVTKLPANIKADLAKLGTDQSGEVGVKLLSKFVTRPGLATAGVGAASATNVGDFNRRAAALAEGLAIAMQDGPSRAETFQTSFRVIPGLFTAPAALALSGMESYGDIIQGEDKTPFAALGTEAKIQGDFMVDMVETLASGDADEIARYIKEDVGLVPFLPLTALAKFGKAGAWNPVRGAIRGKVQARRELQRVERNPAAYADGYVEPQIRPPEYITTTHPLRPPEPPAATPTAAPKGPAPKGPTRPRTDLTHSKGTKEFPHDIDVKMPPKWAEKEGTPWYIDPDVVREVAAHFELVHPIQILVTRRLKNKADHQVVKKNGVTYHQIRLPAHQPPDVVARSLHHELEHANHYDFAAKRFPDSLVAQTQFRLKLRKGSYYDYPKGAGRKNELFARAAEQRHEGHPLVQLRDAEGVERIPMQELKAGDQIQLPVNREGTTKLEWATIEKVEVENIPKSGPRLKLTFSKTQFPEANVARLRPAATVSVRRPGEVNESRTPVPGERDYDERLHGPSYVGPQRTAEEIAQMDRDYFADVERRTGERRAADEAVPVERRTGPRRSIVGLFEDQAGAKLLPDESRLGTSHTASGDVIGELRVTQVKRGEPEPVPEPPFVPGTMGKGTPDASVPVTIRGRVPVDPEYYAWRALGRVLEGRKSRKYVAMDWARASAAADVTANRAWNEIREAFRPHGRQTPLARKLGEWYEAGLGPAARYGIKPGDVEHARTIREGLEKGSIRPATDAVTERRALDVLIENGAIMDDAFWAGVEKYKEVVAKRGGHSVRKQWIASLPNVNRKLEADGEHPILDPAYANPRDVIELLPDDMKHVDRGAARNYAASLRRESKHEEMKGRDVEREQLPGWEQEQKMHLAQAELLSKKSQAVDRRLKGLWDTRTSSPGKTTALLYTPQMAEDFSMQMAAVHERFNWGTPAKYVPAVETTRIKMTGGVRGGLGTPPAGHVDVGQLTREGLASARLEDIANYGIVSPTRSTITSNQLGMTLENGMRTPYGKAVDTAKGAKQALADNKWSEKDIALVPMQVLNPAFRHLPHEQFVKLLENLDPKTGALSPALMEKAMEGLPNNLRREVKAAIAKGGTNVGFVDKVMLSEWMFHAKFGLDWGKGMRAWQAFLASPARVLLNSPGWVFSQLFAKMGPPIASFWADPRNWMSGPEAVRSMGKIKKRDADGEFGVEGAARAILGAHQGSLNVVSMPDGRMLNLGGGFPDRSRNLAGVTAAQVAWGGISGKYMIALDRWSEAHIRSMAGSTVAAKVSRDWIKGVKGMDEVMVKAAQGMKGMTTDQRLVYMAQHPILANAFQDALNRTLGNWSSFSSIERRLAPYTIFYPWLRFSVQWAFVHFPLDHPVSATVLAFLAQQNAEELEGLAGGKLASFRDYANPVTGGREYPFGTRMSPTMGVLAESIASENIAGHLLSGVNPWLSFPFSTGLDKNIWGQPLKGDNYWEKAANMLLETSPAARAGLAAADVYGIGVKRGAGSAAFLAADPLKTQRSVLWPFIPRTPEQTKNINDYSKVFRDREDLQTKIDDENGKPARERDKKALKQWERELEKVNRHGDTVLKRISPELWRQNRRDHPPEEGAAYRSSGVGFENTEGGFEEPDGGFEGGPGSGGSGIFGTNTTLPTPGGGIAFGPGSGMQGTQIPGSTLVPGAANRAALARGQGGLPTMLGGVVAALLGGTPVVAGKASTGNQGQRRAAARTKHGEGTAVDRAFPPNDGDGEQLSMAEIAAVAELNGLPGVTMARLSVGESNRQPGRKNPDDGTPSLFQITPSVQSAATKAQFDKIARQHKGGYTNPIAAAKMAKVLAGPDNKGINSNWVVSTGDYNSHLPGGKAEARRILAEAANGPGDKVTRKKAPGRIIAMPNIKTENGQRFEIDKRIKKDVLAVMRRFKMRPGDGWSVDGDHADDGEHPMGLGVDFYPDTARGGTWEDVDRAARWAEAEQNSPSPPFRWVGYDGDAAHGKYNHLHLSWNHGPTKALSNGTNLAEWVDTLNGRVHGRLAPGGGAIAMGGSAGSYGTTGAAGVGGAVAGAPAPAAKANKAFAKAQAAHSKRNADTLAQMYGIVGGGSKSGGTGFSPAASLSGPSIAGEASYGFSPARSLGGPTVREEDVGTSVGSLVDKYFPSGGKRKKLVT